ncbi:MAG: SDR family oxidoreductase [Flavobacteriales bacterium]|nr:SDR family oxidoreductase [Flavobacteriales bacterium]
MSNGDHSLQLYIGREMVEAFAAFSGDRSSLHIDPEFGRRGMFGANVVHGMLPLMFLPPLVHRSLASDRWRIARAQARFLRPILPGGTVRLTCTVAHAGPGPAKLYFEAHRGDQVATRGSLLVEREGPAAPLPGDRPEGLMVERPDEAEHAFDTITTGIRSTLNFQWGPEQARALRQLQAMAAPAVEVHELEGGDPGAFAQIALLSTLVGMRMPGRTATFQEFELDLEHPLPVGDGSLAAEVGFRSTTAHTIAQDVSIRSGDTAIARGRVSVQVARPPFEPPTMDQLAKEGIDLGLAGQVVLITGASRGIGATTAKLFALHGARVVIDHRASANEADAIVREITDHGGEALAIQADVTDADAVRRMVDQVERTWGPVDVLVNNAVANFRPIPFLGTAWADVQADIDVVLKGAINTSQAVIPGFLTKGGGCIVNVSTIAVDAPPPLQTKYVVAKAALNGLSRALAVEFADRNIRVNMVVPHFVETDLTSGHGRVAVNQMKAASPMKRLATAREVADAIVFLASPRAGYTTGQRSMVTGGALPLL